MVDRDLLLWSVLGVLTIVYVVLAAFQFRGRLKSVFLGLEAPPYSLYKFLFYGFVVSGPSFLGVATYYDPIRIILADYPILAFTCGSSGGFVFLRRALLVFLRGPCPLSERDLALLQTQIEGVVGEKMRRFGREAAIARRNDEKRSPADVFLKITQPDIQIEKMIDAISQIFSCMEEAQHAEIKVAIAEIRENRFFEFLYYCPGTEMPETCDEILRKDTSTFSVAVKRNEITIIEDIDAESRMPLAKRCYEIEPNRKRKGSILCYPLRCRHVGEIVYVISIVASEPLVLTRHRTRRYEYILKLFGHRILLEHSLKILRRRTENV